MLMLTTMIVMPMLFKTLRNVTPRSWAVPLTHDLLAHFQLGYLVLAHKQPQGKLTFLPGIWIHA